MWCDIMFQTGVNCLRPGGMRVWMLMCSDISCGFWWIVVDDERVRRHRSVFWSCREFFTWGPQRAWLLYLWPGAPCTEPAASAFWPETLCVDGAGPAGCAPVWMALMTTCKWKLDPRRFFSLRFSCRQICLTSERYFWCCILYFMFYVLCC